MEWKKPDFGWVKVKVDAYVGVNGVVGLGVSIGDWQGTLLVTATTRTSVAWDARIAEPTVARYGVIIARNIGFTKLCLVGDALYVISTITRK